MRTSPCDFSSLTPAPVLLQCSADALRAYNRRSADVQRLPDLRENVWRNRSFDTGSPSRLRKNEAGFYSRRC
ncbi:hypothetical protein AAFF_G00073400 [Aldrovandia affinis]|uniref:Uncharacterized protein n=1 Tax=Aldrovandia affinis TaxID=143900 RepID=A0AAD7WD25_9TELE|nr:hypothetical protein AAFF_G00073400 [Aldrovandia affinis]